MQSEELTEFERLDYTRTIVQASQKLSGLVNDILNMNKLEHFEIIPQGHPYSLDEQIRRCVVLLEDLWADKEITFSADLEDVIVTYDESLLEIIWNNLISNAVKFTEPGGEISITLQNKNGYISVSVSDTGCGIDEKSLYHIFDKFYQGDTSHSKEGNGLGLAMVKKICDICHGKISVESTLGAGSSFTVILKGASI